MSTTEIGNLVADPEIKFTQGGKPYVNFTIAKNHGKKNPQTGEWEVGEPSYIDCSIFGEMAENFVNSFSKGTRLMVTGSLKQNSWEDKESGQKRSKLQLNVDEVGASVRWATVVATKTQRQDGGTSSPNSTRSQATLDYNDEPF
jgi:single-strand DNA-binding protein